jgi:hypothetical protein
MIQLIKEYKSVRVLCTVSAVCSSVADSNPDPSDPYFFCLLGPDPDPLVRVTDPDPDHSIIKQNLSEKPCFLMFCDFFLIFFFEKLCKCTFKK